MANNITIQYGTGLGKSIIFSSLRQELIRRMTNCSTELNWDERMKIIEEFIQLLINSGHRYPFIKSVTLQAMTRYKYMLRRANLEPGDIKFRPLYRARSYDQTKRKLSKMVEGMTWYKGIETYDKFRNDWKKKVTYRMNRGGFRHRMNNDHKYKVSERKDIECAMFVPPSEGSLLLKYVEDAESKLDDRMEWGVKLVEQSGFPLGMNFIPKFPLEAGCPKGSDCTICGNTAIKCSKKGVVYRATCKWCKDPSSVQHDVINASNNHSLLLQDREDVQQVDVARIQASKDTSNALAPSLSYQANGLIMQNMNHDAGDATIVPGGSKVPSQTGVVFSDKEILPPDEKTDSDKLLNMDTAWTSEIFHTGGMDEMNKSNSGLGELRTVAVDVMNKTPTMGGRDYLNWKRSAVVGDSEFRENVNISYIGETSRPFRERVFEHFQNLKNGSTQSFMISHWMEAHETSSESPEFEWQIIDSYPDALRRQLCEGLYILEEGALNKKMNLTAT